MDIFIIKDKIKRGYYKLLSRLVYSKVFLSFGKGSKIISPLSIKNAEYITIGMNVTINHGIFMMVEPSNPFVKEPRLSICDGTVIGNFNHIVSLNKVVIGKGVLTADRVYISDNYHGYEDISNPVSVQQVKSKGETIIGDGSWIGENCSIISAKIGRHCIVAANSVVISDIPDYSLAAGAPAKIKKKYNIETKLWEKVKK